MSLHLMSSPFATVTPIRALIGFNQFLLMYDIDNDLSVLQYV